MDSRPMPKYIFEKTIFIAVIFSAMVLCTTYQAKMIQYSTTYNKASDITNIKQLVESNLQMSMHSSLKYAVGLETLVDDHSLIKNRKLALYNNRTQAMKRIFEQKDSSYIENDLFCRITESNHYSKETGNKMLNLIPNVVVFPSTLLTLKKSPFRTRFNKILGRLHESAIFHKLYNDELYQIKLEDSKKHLLQNYDLNCMIDLKVIFHPWILSIACCIIVFFFEVGFFVCFSRHRCIY